MGQCARPTGSPMHAITGTSPVASFEVNLAAQNRQEGSLHRDGAPRKQMGEEGKALMAGFQPLSQHADGANAWLQV